MATMFKEIKKATTNVETLPDQTEWDSYEVTLTPALARSWLARNRGNRAMNRTRFKRYSQDMQNGQWARIGDLIRFSKSGRMLDGQTRCQACAATGITIPNVLVVVGVEDDAFDYIDSGKPRTASDILTIEGLTPIQARIAAPALQAAISYKNGKPLYTTSPKATSHDIRMYLISNPKFIHTVEYVESFPRGRQALIPQSMAAALHWEFNKLSNELAVTFFDGLFRGEALVAGNPIFTLRERFINDQVSNITRTRREKFHACIKAWNLLREGRPCTDARSLFPRGSDRFPSIQ